VAPAAKPKTPPLGEQIKPEYLRNDRVWPHHVVILVLDDVAVVNVGLGRGDAIRQVVLRADGRELSGIGFDGLLEAALGRISRLHWSRSKRSRIDPTGDAIGTAVSGLIGLCVEGCAPDHLERD
jgi:hypothetical protein